MATDETESHLVSVTAPKGTGLRKVLELLKAALSSRGHEVTVSNATMSLSAGAEMGYAGPALVLASGGGGGMDPCRRRELLSMSAAGLAVLAEEDAAAGEEGRREGERWQDEQLRQRGLSLTADATPDVTYRW